MDSFFKYLRKNWEYFTISVATSLVLTWVIDSNQAKLIKFFNFIFLYRPPLFYFLLFQGLILVPLWEKTILFWKRYQKFYSQEDSPLCWIDVFLSVFFWPLFLILWTLIYLDPSYFNWEICFIFIFILLSYSQSYYQLKNEEIEENQFGLVNSDHLNLLSDEPINDKSEDLIGRGKFTKSLKDHIYGVSFEESFVIGLYGSWGEGKTSIFNMLMKDIIKEDLVLLYEFDPWFFGNEEAFTINFFLGLEDLLRERYIIPKEVKSYFTIYPEVLLKGFFVNFKFIPNRHDDKNRPKELKKKIEKFILSINKKILVVIDDIDRLQKEEILAIFKLIKLTSQIKNLVFLIGLDPSRIDFSLHIKNHPENLLKFLEKIVQIPIQIPMTDQWKIDRFLLFSNLETNYRSEIDKLLDSLEIENDSRRIFDEKITIFYGSTLQPIFPNFRTAKRYLNSLKFRLPFVVDEVSLYDFFLIEIIQTFFPTIYSDLKNNPKFYVSPWSMEMRLGYPIPLEKEEDLKLRRTHIETFLSNDESEEVILDILRELFPEVKNAFLEKGKGSYATYDGMAKRYRIEKRVAHPDCFIKYFTLDVRESVIPDGEFEELLKVWKKAKSPEHEIKTSFFEIYQKSEKLNDLLQKLGLHSAFIEGDLIFPIIRCICQNCSKFQAKGHKTTSEYGQAEYLIFDLLENQNTILPDEIHPIIEDIINKINCFNLAVGIVHTSNSFRVWPKVCENIQIGKIRKILSDRLKKYFIDGKINIFREYPESRDFAFILYQWATNWEESDRTPDDEWPVPGKIRNEEVTDYLIEIFKKEPKYVGWLLSSFTSENFSDERKNFRFMEFEKGFNPIKFFVCLKELGSKAYSSEREKVVINTFMDYYFIGPIQQNSTHVLKNAIAKRIHRREGK